MTFALGVLAGWLIGSALWRWATDTPIADDVHAYLRGEWS